MAGHVWGTKKFPYQQPRLESKQGQAVCRAQRSQSRLLIQTIAAAPSEQLSAMCRAQELPVTHSLTQCKQPLSRSHSLLSETMVPLIKQRHFTTNKTKNQTIVKPW